MDSADRGLSAPKPPAAGTHGVLTIFLLSVLLLVTAHPASAQTETVLYNFTPVSNGSNPQSGLTSDRVGNLYGMTWIGGDAGAGTVYELSPNGSGGWTHTVLHSFCVAPNCSDGNTPTYAYLTFDSAGNLYGTTYWGGANGYGVVFELSPAGTSWAETVLYNFCSQSGCTDGANPVGNVIMDQAGNLYGTTFCTINESQNPPTSNGGVFELSPSAGGWTEKIIYRIGANNCSYAGLAMDASGNIFGLTNSTVFELSPNGSGGWNPTVVHTFSGPNDGSSPEGTIVFDQAGNLYGTTTAGGTKGYGTVYKLSPGMNGEWTETILYSFGGDHDGLTPWAGIAFDAAGNIYGTTVGGGEFGVGTVSPRFGGTVFELVAPIGIGTYYEKLLWSFQSADLAAQQPYSSVLLGSGGNLYGTTFVGGSKYNAGAVFGVSPSTAVAVASSPNPSWFGQTVTLTAKVSSSGGTPPDGEPITFYDGVSSLNATLSGGIASVTTSFPRVGDFAITAIYYGDANFPTSTSPGLQQIVTRPPTSTVLASGLNPSTYGQKITWTATVTTLSSTPPTGKVNFIWQGTPVGSASLNASGVATLTRSNLNAGSFSLTAMYTGDANNGPSASPILNQVVQQTTSAATISSSLNPSTQGQAVTFTAKITSPTTTPTGPVTFTAGTTVLGSVELSKGEATLTTSALPVGSTTVTVTYPWNSDIAESSASVIQVVQQ